MRLSPPIVAPASLLEKLEQLLARTLPSGLAQLHAQHQQQKQQQQQRSSQPHIGASLFLNSPLQQQQQQKQQKQQHLFKASSAVDNCCSSTISTASSSAPFETLLRDRYHPTLAHSSDDCVATIVVRE